MPLFDFECENCGKKFTIILNLGENGNHECPRCHSKKTKKNFNFLFNLVGVKKPLTDEEMQAKIFKQLMKDREINYQ